MTTNINSNMKNKVGVIKTAKYGKKPSHYVKSRSGAAFERKTRTRLENLPQWENWRIVENPWIVLTTEGSEKPRGVEPDFLMFNDDLKIIILIECKSWRFAEADREIIHLYRPVIEFIHPEYKVYGLVVTTKTVNRKRNPINKITLEEIIENDPNVTFANIRHRSR